jgi:DnaJ-class molecular chaperone
MDNPLNPFVVLGITIDQDDASIRQRYLQLIQQFPPETSGGQFTLIHHAYEQVKDEESRLQYRLFDWDNQDSLEAILKELEWQVMNPRWTIQDLVKLQQKVQKTT